jgi:hypothetical protein
MAVSVGGSIGQSAKETEPCFGASFRIIDLGRLIAARRQILAVCRETDTTNDTKSTISPAIPVIDVAEGVE